MTIQPNPYLCLNLILPQLDEMTGSREFFMGRKIRGESVNKIMVVQYMTLSLYYSIASGLISSR